MIPVIQLDPASLSLWYSPELINRASEAVSLSTPVIDAIWGDVEGAKAFVQSIEGDRLRMRATTLVSTVWHEQRHFLDLIVTNFGAFRVRHFLSAYANAGSVLTGLAREGLPLHCPLAVYSDPVRRAVAGIDQVPEAVAAVSYDLSHRAEMLAVEAVPVSSPYGDLELGGDAQLEALGWAFQHMVTDRVFGEGAAITVQQDLPPPKRAALRYKWAAFLATDFGVGHSLGDPSSGRMALDMTLMAPLLYGSLASRRWGQEQVVTDTHGSGYPAYRLAGLLEALKGRAAEAEADTGIAWRMVNEAAEQLWGRSVVEEMRVDLRFEREWVEQIEEAGGEGHPAARMARDFHALRAGLVDLLETHPSALLSSEGYGEVFPNLRPMPVIAMQGGVLGDPEPALERVLGYIHGDGEHPEGRWWWASVPATWPNDSGTPIALRDREAWISAVEGLAPMAKLMLNGRRHRTMLGPELISAAARLEAQGYDLRIDPQFAFPGEAMVDDSDFIFDITMQEELTCDLCRAPVRRGGGSVVSPWMFRLNAGNARFAVESFGGGEMGFLKHLRDWSPWVLCSKCVATKINQVDTPVI